MTITIRKEKCSYWPRCKKGNSCDFTHPTKTCAQFPNCSYGVNCVFIHPKCRFDRHCTRNCCPFTHYGTNGILAARPAPRAPQAPRAPPASRAVPAPPASRVLPAPQAPRALPAPRAPPTPRVSPALRAPAHRAPRALPKPRRNEIENPFAKRNNFKLIDSLTTKFAAISLESKEEKKRGKSRERRLQNVDGCRYGAKCRVATCRFKHPKECRFGSLCYSPSCSFYHKPLPKIITHKFKATSPFQ